MSNAGCNTMHCPFSHAACTECGIYRGRHRYMAFTRHAEGGRNGSKDSIAAYFRGMEELSNPWAGQNITSEEKLTVRLTLIDAESGNVRPCGLDEARSWDWGDPQTMRIINDRQVTSFEHLVKILCHKDEQGDQEVKLYEFPRFMFLCGG